MPDNDGVEAARFCRNAEVLSRKSENGVLLFNTFSNELFRVNSTGGRIWELLEKEVSAEQIVEVISREFKNTETSRVKNSVREFLQKLSERKLLDRQ